MSRYVKRGSDPRDARRKVILLTARGEDMLRRSVRIFDALRAEWEETIGPERLRALEADLRTVTRGRGLRLDLPGWFRRRVDPSATFGSSGRELA